MILKKTLACIAAFSFCLSGICWFENDVMISNTVIVSAEISDINSVIKGDADCNGVINIQDFMFLSSYIIGLKENINDVQKNASDINNDSIINILDLIRLKNILLSGKAQIVNRGYDKLSFGDYNWRVLDITDDTVLIITEDIIDFYNYNESYSDVTWEKSSVRDYLNTSFLDTFSDDDRARILTTEVDNNSVNEYNIHGGRNTSDKVFLLSFDEVMKYFSSDYDRKAKYDNEYCWWWLRSPGSLLNYAAHVYSDSSIYTHGHAVHDGHDGIRPALRISLTEDELSNLNKNNTTVKIYINDNEDNLLTDALVKYDNLEIKSASDGTAQFERNPENNTVTISLDGYKDYTIDISNGLKYYNIALEKKTNDYETVEFGGYTWRVLDKKEGSMFIVTEDIIEYRRYNESFEDVTWENSDIRYYLNNDFYNSFTDEEKSRIADTHVINNDNPVYNTSGGNDTTDKIFLLSLEEVSEYFNSDADRRVMHDGKYCWWWLRSSGVLDNYASHVFMESTDNYHGHAVNDGHNGIRPALNLITE